MINDLIDKRYEMQKTLKYIKSNKNKLTPQQWRVLKGQCLSGDVEGAKKGFKKIMDRTCSMQKKMKVLELFAGTRSIGKAFESKGHEVFSVEWDKDFENINLYADIGTLKAEDILEKFGKPDVIWASPDCSTFSVAAISKHRRKNLETGSLDPISEYARFCDAVDQNVLKLIKDLNPQFWFIENPRGGMRKMSWMQGLPRYTVTYCQYGERRMKPTDIWTNHPDPQFKPPCKNGDSCHDAAPRGARTGTQGIKGSKFRSIIPHQLCQHIVNICEKEITNERKKHFQTT